MLYIPHSTDIHNGVLQFKFCPSMHPGENYCLNYNYLLFEQISCLVYELDCWSIQVNVKGDPRVVSNILARGSGGTEFAPHIPRKLD